MATVADAILYKLGFDGDELKQGLDNAQDNLKKTGKEMEGTGSTWKGVVGKLVASLAGPIAGFFSLRAVANSYISDVAQVAEQTGYYNKALEEQRKKAALLERVRKEDLEFYKKGREALTKFQITMSDFAADIVRSAMPALEWMTEKLNVFSTWVSANTPNIIRFSKILLAGLAAGAVALKVVSVGLAKGATGFKALSVGISACTKGVLKFTAALLTNPLTWVVLGVAALILVIDDLFTYLNGGDSLFGAFWGPCIEYAKKALEWVKKTWETVQNSTAFKIVSKAINDFWNLTLTVFNWLWNAILKFWDGFGGMASIVEYVGGVISGVFEAIGGVISGVIGAITMVWGAFVALFTGDTSIMEQGWTAFCEGIQSIFNGVGNVIASVVTYLSKVFWGFLGIFGIGKQTVTEWGDKLREALNVGRLIDWVKAKLKNLLPDWILKMMGAESSKDNTAAEAEAPQYNPTDAKAGIPQYITITKTDAPAVPRQQQQQQPAIPARAMAMSGFDTAPVSKLEKGAQINKTNQQTNNAKYDIHQTINVQTDNPNLASRMMNDQTTSAINALQRQNDQANAAAMATFNH